MTLGHHRSTIDTVSYWARTSLPAASSATATARVHSTPSPSLPLRSSRSTSPGTPSLSTEVAPASDPVAALWLHRQTRRSAPSTSRRVWRPAPPRASRGHLDQAEARVLSAPSLRQYPSPTLKSAVLPVSPGRSQHRVKLCDGVQKGLAGLHAAATALSAEPAVVHVLPVALTLVAAGLADPDAGLEHRPRDFRVVLGLT